MTDIAPLTDGDLKDAQALLRDLGYDIDAGTLTTRLTEVLRRDDHAAFIARDADRAALGLVHIYVRAALEKPVEGYVQSLVVSSTARRQGVAKALMETAEDWAKDRGLASVALHTQMHRDDAVAFYTAHGYAEITQSRMLRKTL